MMIFLEVLKVDYNLEDIRSLTNGFLFCFVFGDGVFETGSHHVLGLASNSW